ncbi:MAG: efflux RND transporter periplasmic adaptor subunit [Reichenbachiella sp.]|uniref:efflux RND transporter periplasmic adaptor subunit n=1 Tax=Reichenbachiella sp. TaxID=2184521 RepID=UPI0032998FAB
MKNSFKYIKSIFIHTLLALVVIACESQSKVEQEAQHHEEENEVELTQAQYDQARLELGSIKKRNIGSELQVNGMIDVPPQSNISINMPYGGFIKFIDMLPGTKVRKGQLLAVIENPEFIQYQQDYLEGLANQEYLKAEFDRQQKLYNEKVASGKSFQQAKSSYLANEARIKSMVARLKLIGLNTTSIRNGKVSTSVNIYAPVSGYVREVYTNIGKFINPKDVIMDITNADDLHVELTVYENDIPKVKDGQRIRFSLANTPDQWREAEVFLIGRGVREDRSVTVHGHLKEKYEDLLPGMYVSAKIETDMQEVWAVPEQAVVRFGGKHFIFAYTETSKKGDEKINSFDMLEVVVGNTEDGFAQVELINSSLEYNEVKLVTKGAFTLLAKAKNTEEEGGGHGH